MEAQGEGYWPAYRSLLNSGELERRVRVAAAGLALCRACPRACEVNHHELEAGDCGGGLRAIVGSHQLHFGEEVPLVGEGGSGAIFFGRCNMRCHFCQNQEISHGGQGKEVTAQELSSMMLELQDLGAHNINLVSPSHVVPQILEAVHLAAKGGLSIPLVYNSGGYDSVATLRLLDGVIDIYMPDAKFGDASVAQKYSEVTDYPYVNQLAVKEMHRQVGDLEIDDKGIAKRGLMVRHLVLPDGLAGTETIARFLAQEISKNTYVNVMSQYYPRFRAFEHAELRRRITWKEYLQAISTFRAQGLHRFAE